MSSRNEVASTGLKMENNTAGKQKGREEKDRCMDGDAKLAADGEERNR